MASKITQIPVFKAATRSYAAQAATKIAASVEGLQISKLPSGTVVASIENNSPISKVAVFLRAGSRYDTVPGTSNILRMCATAGLSSQQRTGLSMTRSREQFGGVLNVDSDKEMAVYSVASNRDNVGESLSELSSLTSNNSYVYYEFPSERHTARLKAMMEIEPQQRVQEMAMKAAFRSQSLGNSIYVPDYNVGKITVDQLNEFVQCSHGNDGLVVVGSGVQHEVLAAGAVALGVSGGGVLAQSPPASYIGGDMRLETGGSQAHVIVAGKGGKMGSAEGIACAIAAEVLGSGATVKYGSNISSLLVRAAKGAATSHLSGFANSFSDNGILGFAVSAPAADAPKLVASLMASMRSFSANEKDVAGAKSRVKAALLSQAGSCSELCSIGQQLLLAGDYTDVSDAIKEIDAVTPAAVAKAVSQAFNGKLTVAALGNINEVPYSDTV